MSYIANIIRQLAKTDGETVALVCTVDAIDRVARTIDCTPLNEGAPLLGVNLQANQEVDFGLCLFPEKGSYVVVGFVADGAAGVVLLTEKMSPPKLSSATPPPSWTPTAYASTSAIFPPILTKTPLLSTAATSAASLRFRT